VFRYVRGFPVFVSTTESLPLLCCRCDKWTYLNMSHWPGVRKTSRVALSLSLSLSLSLTDTHTIFLLTNNIISTNYFKTNWERGFNTHRRKEWWKVFCIQNKATGYKVKTWYDYHARMRWHKNTYRTSCDSAWTAKHVKYPSCCPQALTKSSVFLFFFTLKASRNSHKELLLAWALRYTYSPGMTLKEWDDST